MIQQGKVSTNLEKHKESTGNDDYDIIPQIKKSMIVDGEFMVSKISRGVRKLARTPCYKKTK